MSDQAEQSQNTEYQYPDQFKHAIAEIFGNIPRIAKNVKAYQIRLAKDSQSEKLQIQFHIPDETEDMQANVDAVANFIGFVVEMRMDGVSYHEESGFLSFQNAGVFRTNC